MRANPFLVLPLLLLAACGGGGGGGGNSAPTPVANQSLSGTVADGYLAGATVCLDLNSNGLCDNGEPSTTTTAGGAYSLSFPGSTSLTGLNLVVNVPVGAIDSDFPSTPISLPYKLAAPASANVSGVLNINPLMALVAGAMRNNSSLSYSAATTLVLTTLGLPSTVNPAADYLATGTANPAVHNVNQLLATVLQNLNANGATNTATLTQALQTGSQYGMAAYNATTPAALAAATQSAVEATLAGQLVSSVPAMTYTGQPLVVANSINALRKQAGVGLVAQVSALDTSSTNHALYLRQQSYVGDHTETSGQPGFTGATPLARATANGVAYPAASVSEDLVLGAADGATCFAALENSVYHLASLMAPFLNVGVAFDVQASTGSACVVTLGNRTGTFGQYGASGTLAVYPASGQTGVPPTYFNQAEVPNPLPAAQTAGHAVVVSLYSLGNTTSSSSLAGSDVAVHAFTLKQGTTTLPVTVLAATGATSDGPMLTADANLPGNGFVVAVPNATLMPNTVYTATFSATVKGVNVSKTWSFTTGAQN